MSRCGSQLLLALDRTGRPGDALLAYQRLRRSLADELGTHPSPELTALYEAILVQDPRLLLPPGAGPGPSRPDAAVRNPFKGLRPFTEADEDDFFGRDELVRSMLEVLGDPDRPLLALVGPSGSGKSSVVHAGLVPTLRSDGVPGLGPVTIVALVPGLDPFGALAAALAAATGCSAAVPLAASERWLSELLDQAAEPGSVVVVLDQFEELFTLVADHTVQRRFLDAIDQALDEHGARLRVVVAMRADLFDRPLAHPDFGRRFVAGTVAVLPLTPEQLEAAAVGPAERAGLTVEPALLAALIADLADQPGALPLFQYALTELVERRVGGSTLTLEAYRAFGGIDGAVSRRAEEVYARLTHDEQAVARQLFLRLVHPGEHATDSRRRVPASELGALDVDPLASHTVLDRFGRARLLSFDRDPRTGGPTIELAHDALLQAWGRLRTWVDEARGDLQRRASLAAAAAEWRTADAGPDDLLIGARLARYEAWAATTSLVLAADERRYLDVSVARRDEEPVAEDARREAEDRLRRRARRRLVGLAASLVVLVAVVITGAVVLLAAPTADVALLRVGGDGGFEVFMDEGIDRVGRSLDVATEVVIAKADPAADVRGLCAGGADLVFVGGFTLVADGLAAAADCPETTLALLDANGLEDLPACGGTTAPDECLPAGVVPVTFATEEASFLAGAAAARTTRTGVIGFIGGNPIPLIEEFRAGFEAGAHHVDPDVRVLAIFLTDSFELPDLLAAFGDVPLGREAAVQLHAAGADVVFPAAGDSGRGAAGGGGGEHAGSPAVGDRRRHRLGADGAGACGAGARLGREAARRGHGGRQPGPRGRRARVRVPALRAGRRWVELSRRGGHLDPLAAELDELRDAIADGTIEVPRWPTGPVLPTPEQALVLREAELTFTGDACTYRGTRELEEGQGLAVTLVDRSGDGFTGVGYQVDDPPPLDPAPIEWPLDAAPPDYVVSDSASARDVEPGGRTRLVVPAVAGTTVELGCQRDAGDAEHYLHRRAGQVEVTG